MDVSKHATQPNPNNQPCASRRTSIMLSAMRSLMEPPGLARSSLTKADTELGNSRLILTRGVRPMVRRMLSNGAIATLCRGSVWVCGWVGSPCGGRDVD